MHPDDWSSGEGRTPDRTSQNINQIFTKPVAIKNVGRRSGLSERLPLYAVPEDNEYLASPEEEKRVQTRDSLIHSIQSS